LLTVAIGSALAAVRLKRANVQVQKSRDDAVEKLRVSYVVAARARRRSGQGGQRFASLEDVRKAAAIRPSLEVRNEAIACLAVSDMRPRKPGTVRSSVPEPAFRFDPKLK